MARKKTFAVIGLGRFGYSVLTELIQLDNEDDFENEISLIIDFDDDYLDNQEIL